MRSLIKLVQNSQVDPGHFPDIPRSFTFLSSSSDSVFSSTGTRYHPLRCISPETHTKENSEVLKTNFKVPRETVSCKKKILKLLVLL